MSERRYNLILVIISAVFCSLAFLLDELSGLILIGLVPLCLVLFQQQTMASQFFYGGWFGLLFSLLSMSWLLMLYPMEFAGFNHVSGLIIILGWLAIGLLLAFRMLLVPFLFSLFEVDGWHKVLLFAASWTMYEWISEMGSVGFPWFRIALPLANFPLLIQGSQLFGSIGMSFLLVLWNAGIAECWLQWKKEKQTTNQKKRLSGQNESWNTDVVDKQTSFSLGRIKQSHVLVIALMCLGISVISLGYLSQDNVSGDPIAVAVIQGNYATDVKWSIEGRQSNVQTYINQSKEAIAHQAKLIVWPETAIPFAIDDDPVLLYQLDALVQENIELVYGVFEETDTKLFNSFRSLRSGDAYHKQQLVPIGEYIPTWLSTLLPLLNDFQLANQLSKSTQTSLLETQYATIGSLICFDSIFPTYARHHTVAGADLIVIASNDAWYAHTSEITQHKNHAIFRAVESQRYVVRAANTGLSLIVDAKGNEVSTIKQNTQGILYGEVYRNTEISIFHRFPYLIHLLCLIVFVGMYQKVKLSRLQRFWQSMKYGWIH